MNNYLSHADIEAILKKAPKMGKLSLAHAEYEPKEYGFYDQDNLGKDLSELSPHPDTAGFERIIKIAPKVPKCPAWVDKIWDSITVMPNGRLSSNIISAFETGPEHYVVATEKAGQTGEAIPFFSVVADSFYIKTKLDRDDILDLSDFDVVAYIKASMQNKMKEFFVNLFIKDGAKPSIVPIESASNESFDFTSDDILSFAQYDKDTSDMSLIISSSIFAQAMASRGIASLSDVASFIGVKEIIPVPESVFTSGIVGLLMDLSKYCVGLPKGLSGDFFSDFDIDYNTYTVLLEAKACAIPCDKAYSFSSRT